MQKKIFKFFSIVSLIIIFFIVYEITDVSNKIINRSLISFDLNNIRNPQVKKTMRYLNDAFASFRILFSQKSKIYYNNNDDDRDNFSNEIIIKKTDQYSENIFPKNHIGENWHRNHGDSSSIRFSKLKLINKKNLDKLSVAWKYSIPDGKPLDIQSNAIVAEKKIFISSFNKKIIALDAISGKPVWEFFLDDIAPRRGMLYLPGKNKEPSKLIFSSRKKLICLNAKNGKTISHFGKNGKVKLKRASITSPAVFENNLIITTAEPSVEIYDLDKGDLLWKFLLMKKEKDEIGVKKHDYSGGNPWGGFSLDKNRGIVYITTGNAGRWFNGVNRPGKNKYANSIIALDIKNKKKLWDFQEVRHDIWNLDIPAPPILGSITRNKRKIDVVISVTKLGNTLVLDRLTGKPIYDFHLKKAPKSKVPGEKTNFYQPLVKIPEPFAKQIFTLDDVTNINEDSKKYILDKIKNHKYGFFEPYELGKKNVQFSFHGGAEWAGGSYDLKNEKLFVTSSNIAWETEITLNKKKGKFSPEPYYKYNSKFTRLKDQDGYPGNKPPWGTITAIDLQKGKIIWQKPFGEYPELTKKGISITGTENYSGVTGTESGILLATGTLDKKFRIYDAENGDELWSYNLPYIGSSPPITYQIDNEQFILINSTGSYSLKKGYPDLVKFGNEIMVFKLRK